VVGSVTLLLRGNVLYEDFTAHEAGEDGVLVRVVDNGSGITEQVQSRLFSPFETTKEESGTGLGLWVCRSILEKHRGSIRLSSSADLAQRGTTVEVFLPLRTQSPRAANHGSAIHDGSAP